MERYIIFSSQFQLNLYKEVDEIFIDGTFKIVPKNWYQLLNIFGFIKSKNFYTPLSYILLSSKNQELYDEVFTQLIKFIKIHSNFNNFTDIKVMRDFELGLRKSIKKNFVGCLLQGCFFHFSKAIWAKIKKLGLFKKNIG